MNLKSLRISTRIHLKQISNCLNNMDELTEQNGMNAKELSEMIAELEDIKKNCHPKLKPLINNITKLLSSKLVDTTRKE